MHNVLMIWTNKEMSHVSRRLILCSFVCFSFLLFFNPSFGQAQIHISAHNSVLMEASTGRVLFDKKAHDIQSVASLTKVMTAIIVIEADQMDDSATASRRAIHTSGSSIYLEQGEQMTVEDLTYGLMLRSGNDAAVTLAEHIGGSVEGFVHLMNEKAKWLGMTNTNFANPHGLEDENHVSTAYDLAILMRYAMDNKTFRSISRTKKYRANNRSYDWFNKNKLLTHLYEHCTGGKTGFTKRAGRTLITTAKQNNMDLIAVTLNASNDWQDHIQLFEWGFNHFEMTLIDDHYYFPEQFKQINPQENNLEKSFKRYPLTSKEKLLLQNDRMNKQSTNKSHSKHNHNALNENPLAGHYPTTNDLSTTENFLISVKHVYQRIVHMKGSAQ